MFSDTCSTCSGSITPTNPKSYSKGSCTANTVSLIVDSVSLKNDGNTSGLVSLGSTQPTNFESSTWVHIVVTVMDGTVNTYKNGVLIDATEVAPGFKNGILIDSTEVAALVRTYNFLGRSTHTSNGYFDGTIAYLKMWHGIELTEVEVIALYAPHNTAHHFWDFRGCTTGTPVTDSIAGDLAATPTNGPTCSLSGISFDGSNDYVDIDDWEWGSTTSFETYVKYDSFNENSRVLDFHNSEEVVPAIEGTSHACPDQVTFFHTVNHNGNAKMANGDEAVLNVGTWTCGECDSSHSGMYSTQNLYGTIRCKQDDLGCVQDAESNRRIMYVYGTAGEVLTIRGIHFYQGQSLLGGGMYNEGAIVSLELCYFTSCRANGSGHSSYGGGAVYTFAGSLQVYATSFSSNTAATGDGADIFTWGGAVTVHNTCPVGEGGAPAEGEVAFDPIHFLLAAPPQN